MKNQLTPPKWIEESGGLSAAEMLELTRKQSGTALAPEDLLLAPNYTDFAPSEADVTSRIAASLSLKTPILSSAMPTVTGPELAIALARQGGLGILPATGDPKDRAAAIARVRHNMHGLIRTPKTARASQTVAELAKTREDKGWSFFSFPVTDGEGNLCGLLTQQHFRMFAASTKTVEDVMTRDIQTVPQGTKASEALAKMEETGRKVLPVVDGKRLVGLYLLEDVIRAAKPGGLENTDENGQLLVGAAIGLGQIGLDHLEILMEADPSAIVIDTASIDSAIGLETIAECRKRYPNLVLIAGNVANHASAYRAFASGANAVKVGLGPGSICTTREVSGAGWPQWSAVAQCAQVAQREFGGEKTVIADGGITTSGAVAKLLAGGASAVMIGNLFARTLESPGEIIEENGARFKVHRGMGSRRALEESVASRQRYSGSDSVPRNVTAEGVEGRVPYSGQTVRELVEQLEGGVRSGMRYSGCKTIPKWHKHARFVRVTEAGKRESAVHDLVSVVR